MPEGTATEPKGTCFVVMGFGKKTDFETGRTLDLDKTYKNIIKPAVEAAGLKCVRADDIIHSGPIEVPMYEELLSADVVVADLFHLEPECVLRTWRAPCAQALYDNHHLRGRGQDARFRRAEH